MPGQVGLGLEEREGGPPGSEGRGLWWGGALEEEPSQGPGLVCRAAGGDTGLGPGGTSN